MSQQTGDFPSQFYLLSINVSPFFFSAFLSALKGKSIKEESVMHLSPWLVQKPQSDISFILYTMHTLFILLVIVNEQNHLEIAITF